MEPCFVDFLLTHCKYLNPTNLRDYVDTTCPICQEDLLDTYRSFVEIDTPTCKHIMCAECLSRYISFGHAECPLCRTNWFEHVQDPTSGESDGNSADVYRGVSAGSDFGYHSLGSEVNSQGRARDRADSSSTLSSSSRSAVYDYNSFLTESLRNTNSSERTEFLEFIRNHFPLWSGDRYLRPVDQWRQWRSQIHLTNIPWDPENEAKQMRDDIEEAMGRDSDAKMFESVKDPFLYWKCVTEVRRWRNRD